VVSHAASNGWVITEPLPQMGVRLRNVHLSDFRQAAMIGAGTPPLLPGPPHNAQLHRAPGEGVLPLRAFLRALQRREYDGLLTIDMHELGLRAWWPPTLYQRLSAAVTFCREALVQYESGQSATMIYSFDSAQTRTLLEITGTEGTMLVPDPNMFEGEIGVRKLREDDFTVVATTTAQSSRGTGALDIARAIREGRPHRAQGVQAFHVLDTMVAIAESGERGEFVAIDSTFEKPALLPEDWDPMAATV